FRAPGARLFSVAPREGGGSLPGPYGSEVHASSPVRQAPNAHKGVSLRGERDRQSRGLLLGQLELRARDAINRELRQVPMVPEYHWPQFRRARRESPAPSI